MRLRPQQLVADVMTAVQYKHHSASMSSVEAGSSLNSDATLCANAVRTSLSANDYHWIQSVFRGRKVFRFLKGFTVLKCRQLGSDYVAVNNSAHLLTRISDTVQNKFAGTIQKSIKKRCSKKFLYHVYL